MRNSETNNTKAGWLQLLMAGSVAGGLLLVPVVQAEDADAAQAVPAVGAESVATPAAVPPPLTTKLMRTPIRRPNNLFQ